MEKWKWIEEIIDGEDEKLKSNILDDLKILIFSNWGAQENLLRKLCEKKGEFQMACQCNEIACKMVLFIHRHSVEQKERDERKWENAEMIINQR